jgi:hypothetical protein
VLDSVYFELLLELLPCGIAATAVGWAFAV